jgi:hypothetical protein
MISYIPQIWLNLEKQSPDMKPPPSHSTNPSPVASIALQKRSRWQSSAPRWDIPNPQSNLVSTTVNRPQSQNGWYNPFPLEGFLMDLPRCGSSHFVLPRSIFTPTRSHLQVDSPTPWPVLTFALAFALAAFALAFALAFTDPCSRSCPRFGRQTWQWQLVDIFWSTVRPKFWDTPQPGWLTLQNGPLYSNPHMKSVSD